jgi:hypothetical protein
MLRFSPQPVEIPAGPCTHLRRKIVERTPVPALEFRNEINPDTGASKSFNESKAVFLHRVFD